MYQRRTTAAIAVLSVVFATMPAGPLADSAGARSAPIRQHQRSAPVVYSPPVDGVVIDPFRLPDGPYGAGNRGLEYETVPGAPVRAIGSGVVAFAGPVAGRLVLSVVHPDGLRSSLTGLATLSAVAGDAVSRGTAVGTAGTKVHLGVREAGNYIDPALLFAGTRRRAVLVPVPR